MWVRGRRQSTMQTEVCQDRILNNQALFLRLTALGDSGWLWTCRKCYSDRNDNDSLNITCCKGPQRPHSDTADSLWVTNSSENTTVVLLSYSHAKGITNKLSEALSDEQRAREDKSGSHLPWVKSEVSELRRLLTPGLQHTWRLSVLSQHSCLSAFQSYSPVPKDGLQDAPIRILTIPFLTKLGFHTHSSPQPPARSIILPQKPVYQSLSTESFNFVWAPPSTLQPEFFASDLETRAF